MPRKIMTIRVSEEEKASWHRLAAAHGLTLSAWIRDRCKVKNIPLPPSKCRFGGCKKLGKTLCEACSEEVVERQRLENIASGNAATKRDMCERY